MLLDAGAGAGAGGVDVHAVSAVSNATTRANLGTPAPSHRFLMCRGYETAREGAVSGLPRERTAIMGARIGV
ncbi:hypothetical protein GCM10022267_55860 [Lentzea roselyniae]|uniref:Uncharacterized protein n=1 Tax=Lentzea roselyniae TaxID=531940 RepID=A0ABP7BL65_9PSEU